MENDEAAKEAEELLYKADCGRLDHRSYVICKECHIEAVAAALQKRDHNELAKVKDMENDAFSTIVERSKQVEVRNQLARIHLAMMRSARVMDPRDRQTIENALEALDNQGAELAALRAALSDPPPDVQELVIKKLDLVSRDEVVRLRAKAEEQAREIEDAIQLMVKHGGIVGEHHGLLDYLRNLLQVTVTSRDNAAEAMVQLAAAEQEKQARFVAGMEAAKFEAWSIVRDLKGNAGEAMLRMKIDIIDKIDARIAAEKAK